MMKGCIQDFSLGVSRFGAELQVKGCEGTTANLFWLKLNTFPNLQIEILNATPSPLINYTQL